MAVIKCKMCGGDIELSADKTFGTCEYCGSLMTLPKIADDHRAAAFNRGNHFRRIGEFDKALAVYERIVEENNSDAEAHWCCALCRYGIEYVEDPTTYEWLPTCHRASFDNILDDVDYLAALEYSDGITRRQYQKNAVKIAEVQRAILATSQKEDPFDVFICYKESDADGNRTVDSMLAQDIYYQLTDKGYRVFFSRITLEDKVGEEYEPYIFAALSSAKVMVVIGTKPEYVSAVWVKNEWNRFLALMRKDRSKLLLPCYRDMDPYDLPEQLSILQSYDMAKIGFIQDLIRGISKIVDVKKDNSMTNEMHVIQSERNSNIDALIKRGMMALEDREWKRADDFFEQVLNQDAECGQAYWGKFLLAAKVNNAIEYGEKLFDRILSKKKESKSALKYDLVRIARNIKEAEEVLGFFTDDELSKILSQEFITSDFEYTDYLSYFEKEKEIVSSQGIGPYLDTGLYSRVLQFADSEITSNLNSIHQVVLNRISEKIQVEKDKIEGCLDYYKRTEKDIERQIANRLHPVILSYRATKSVLENERIEAEKKYESDYSKALKTWREAKTNYRMNHDKAISEKRRLRDELVNLQHEARETYSLFQIKKRRELDKRISELQNLADSIVVPEDPGDAPVKRQIFQEYLLSTNSTYLNFKERIIFALSPKEKEKQEQLNQFIKQIGSVATGAIIPFGRYYYADGNDIKPIEWIVMQVVDNEYVWLMSKNVIDTADYSFFRDEPASWVKSYLRRHLNDSFIQKAFSIKERAFIVQYEELPRRAKSFVSSVQPEDKVYPLSYAEYLKYRYPVTPTPYVKHCLRAYSDWYWLRSVVSTPINTIEPQCVMDKKVSYTYPTLKIGVRPTLWVRISATK